MQKPRNVLCKTLVSESASKRRIEKRKLG